MALLSSSLARNFLNRAILCLPYSKVPDFLESKSCSSGFSLNIGNLATLNMSNIEVSPTTTVHTKYGNGTGYHFNRLVEVLLRSHFAGIIII